MKMVISSLQCRGEARSEPEYFYRWFMSAKDSYLAKWQIMMNRKQIWGAAREWRFTAAADQTKYLQKVHARDNCHNAETSVPHHWEGHTNEQVWFSKWLLFVVLEYAPWESANFLESMLCICGGVGTPLGLAQPPLLILLKSLTLLNLSFHICEMETIVPTFVRINQDHP